MTTSTFQRALDHTLRHEGGFYDGSEERDPNPTNYGVTQKTYDHYREGQALNLRPVKEIQRIEVEAIYFDYWRNASCELLPPLTAMAVFDMAINAGPKTAVKCLQRALGANDDGIVGPKTREQIELFTRAASKDRQLAEGVCWERLRHYVDLAKSPRLRPNLLAWTLRVVKFREEFLR